MMHYPAVNNTDLEFFSTPHCKVRNSSYRLLFLFLSGHALSLAPTGIQLHTLAADCPEFCIADTAPLTLP